MDAYSADHFEEANRLFHEAADLAAQADLRILNGLYLTTDAPDLAVRLAAEGKGFRENLIALGTDDLRDAMHRRVELVVTSCPS
jgi:hypothetical protein